MSKNYNFQYTNPCIELFGNSVLNKGGIVNVYEDHESSVTFKKIENFRRNLVDHLQTVGWEINHEWLDKVAEENDPNGDEILRRTVWGMYKGDYHLISNCGKFTVRIKKINAVFWRRSPKWKELVDVDLNEIELTDKGIKCEGIIEITVK